MPELPEVETIKNQLAVVALGKKITGIEIIEKRSFIGDKSLVLNKIIKKIGRNAKVLRIILDDDSALFIHFKMTGQMFWQERGGFKPAKFTRVILTLSDGSRLLFNDPRKFGWIKAVADAKKEPVGAAIEPFRNDFTFDNLVKIFKKSRKPIKLMLMDQEKIGGIGNIYANESLFRARISPFRPANSLAEGEIEKLREAILAILEKAIKCRGSSGKDEWYRQLNGRPGCYQEHFLVYQRQGAACPGNCAGKIKREKQGGRSSFYCPACQK